MKKKTIKQVWHKSKDHKGKPYKFRYERFTIDVSLLNTTDGDNTPEQYAATVEYLKKVLERASTRILNYADTQKIGAVGGYVTLKETY